MNDMDAITQLLSFFRSFFLPFFLSSLLSFFLSFLLFLVATPLAHGSSWARDGIQTTAVTYTTVTAIPYPFL